MCVSLCVGRGTRRYPHQLSPKGSLALPSFPVAPSFHVPLSLCRRSISIYLYLLICCSAFLSVSPSVYPFPFPSLSLSLSLPPFHPTFLPLQLSRCKYGSLPICCFLIYLPWGNIAEGQGGEAGTAEQLRAPLLVWNSWESSSSTYRPRRSRPKLGWHASEPKCVPLTWGCTGWIMRKDPFDQVEGEVYRIARLILPMRRPTDEPRPEWHRPTWLASG